MRKTGSLALATLVTLSLIATLSLSVSAKESSIHLMVVEVAYEHGRVTPNVIPRTDNSMSNPDYKLLAFHWWVTAQYWINPTNYVFSVTDVVSVITASADTWDVKTSAAVFSYVTTTDKSAGTYDGYNVVAWGAYRVGVIAVTYIWYSGNEIVETDTKMNTYYKWSLSGEPGKMDVQNIMTHEFGHWCGLNDLYANKDYWLTMYGYANYGETYKQTLGLGDILGLQAVYGK